MSALRRHRRSGTGAQSLAESLQALASAVELASGRLPGEALAPAREVLERAARRQGLASGRTVVALLGATGSGKSSLFNALVGRELARVAPRRPTTTRPLAAVWGEDDAGELLDWLEVPERVLVEAGGPVGGEEATGGLVLVDLPDIDSTSVLHRQVADRMAGRVDVLVWVLDPQKYADAIVHRDYLVPMAAHAEVTLVVLNQVDTLEEAERGPVLRDLAALLDRDGLGSVEVLPVSARTGSGVAELGERLAAVAAGQSAARARLAADVRAVAGELARAAELTLVEGRGAVAQHDQDRLTDAAARAAGVEAVRSAVRRGYVRSARRHVGWPPVRWLQRLRPDPVRRLHLDQVSDPELVRTSVPAATPVQEAAVRSSAHALVSSATAQLPDFWRSAVLRETETKVPALVDSLDRAVAGTDLERGRNPLWWRVLGAGQWLLLAAAVVGGLWLGALAGMAYLQLPRPEVPMAGPLPWPTVLAAGGLVLGLLLALVGGAMARFGARRRAARVDRRLRAAVGRTVTEQLVEPLGAELDEYVRLTQLVTTLSR